MKMLGDTCSLVQDYYKKNVHVVIVTRNTLTGLKFISVLLS